MRATLEPEWQGPKRPDLRRFVFIPLVGMVIVLFLALGSAALWSETRSAAENLERDVDSAARLFELQVASDVDTMRIAMEPILVDRAIIECFMSEDRDALFAMLHDRFRALREQHGVSHMYFVYPDRVSFLRVHQPDNYGEVIERFTMREAQRTGELASGLELGILGVPSLRVVSPVQYEGRIVGYFELGREVEEYAVDARQTLGIDVEVLVRKDLVVEEEWAKGQVLLGRQADWDRFDEFVATGSADGGEELGQVLDQGVPLLSRDRSAQVSQPGGRRFAVGARPLLDASRQQIGLLVVSLDVTESVIAFRRTLAGFLILFVLFSVLMVWLLYGIVRRTERSLEHAEAVEREALVQLEERVRERTAQLNREIAERELAEAQLRQAQKMEVIGQLTGGVAHDFNNLLAIIMVDLELVRDRLAEDGLEDMIEGAWEATERGAALIARLLAISRRQPLSPRPVDPNQLVDELVPLLERAVRRGISVETDFEQDSWNCFVDPSQLENLILNLVINARDAMPDGGTVTIKTRNRNVETSEARQWEIPAGAYVELTVTDTGTGMAPEVLARALDPFYTTKEVGKGSGLGLAMVHGTVKQSGGHLELESTPGVGTSVRLLLPRVEPARRDSHHLVMSRSKSMTPVSS